MLLHMPYTILHMDIHSSVNNVIVYDIAYFKVISKEGDPILCCLEIKLKN